MITYSLKRILLMIPTLFGIMLITFTVTQFVPGGPVEKLVAEIEGQSGGGETGVSVSAYRGDMGLDQERIEELKHLYGFDQPPAKRFLTMMAHYLRFDFGTSYYYQQDVVALVISRMPVSMSLGLWTFLIVYGVCMLMLPVSWVHKGIHRASSYDHSLDETMLILPGVVAAIVLVVQHSLALAFSLAGIVAGVQFRRALQDTFDALFILVAIGTGIAAGVSAIEIATVLTMFFSYATLYVYFYGDGLESDYAAQKKALKQLRKEAEHEADH